MEQINNNLLLPKRNKQKLDTSVWVTAKPSNCDKHATVCKIILQGVTDVAVKNRFIGTLTGKPRKTFFVIRLQKRILNERRNLSKGAIGRKL